MPASPPPRRRRSWLSVLMVLLFIGALVGGAWYLVHRAKTPVAATAGGPGGPGSGGPGGPGGPFGGGRGPGGGVTVGSARAVQGDLPVLIDALGTVTPPVTATLVPQVGGVLAEVLFTEGQSVKKGQVLARIDPRQYEQALAQAKGQRAKDEAQLSAARLTLQRYQRLWDQDSIARQDVDTQAALVKQLEGVVEADRASERAAQLNVGYTTIRSPIDGRIGLRTVDPGNLVSAGSTTGIATVTQMNPIDVVFSVPQDRVPDVLAAQKAAGAGKLPVQALNRERTQQLAEGRFLTLDNQVNVSTGTVKAKARYANADGTLFPNQFVNVRLQLGTVSGVLVPVTAVRTGPQGDYVYVVDDQHTAHMRAVTRGLATVDQILIEKGVQAGERVVTEGGDRVKDGGKVQLGGSGGSGSGAGGGADDAAAGAAGASAGASAAGSAGRRRGASAPAGAGTAPVGASAAAPAASTGNSEPKVAPAQAQQAQAASNSGASSAPAGAASASTYNLDDPAKRPPWWDRLPPEVQQKLLAMSPDERRAYLQELRERRRAAREAGQ
ncbi:MAG: efflux RND transporter periplasmic adaptor subunit [Burkholderiaceae bacterium]|nr:efflux RND transporter periplasmic adaptor subunit [Ottowia sp.]MCP5258217.1 efflux RND transporter periplasmic adaptor subunit [Burkholderiaceae bacterium]HRW71301.1 efflux RND transporter periplasmic adaptor subunit [Ottowia sp.]